MSAKQQKSGGVYCPDFKVLLLVTILMTSTLINVPAQHSSSWDSQEPIQWNNNIDFSFIQYGEEFPVDSGHQAKIRREDLSHWLCNK